MFKVAIIGTGGRSVCYAQAYKSIGDVAVVALADPDAEHRKAMATQAGLDGGYREYNDWRDLLREHGDLDGVVICTPNHLHADQAVPCLERGLPVALEKPLATTQSDCERILDAERAGGGRVLLGFVLRSTPFYATIHELIAAGAIGEVVSIQADELPGTGVTSIMNRSPWRRHAGQSGGSMLEKSCHDMDILNWMMGCRPVSLNSYGSTLIFRPDPARPRFCDECDEAPACKYYRQPALSTHEDKGEAALHRFIRENNRCIYNIDKDVADVQGICLEYESGAVANFMLNFHCMGPRAGRNFHAIGKRGRIWGNHAEHTVYHHDNRTGATTAHDTHGDGSGHGGGDLAHALLLRRMMQDAGYRPAQGADAGYLSAVMCFAADLSRAQRRRMNFAYGPAGRIALD
ncbi:MAG: Gfo/Idh/MocA family oxidoreductase [bacterium]|nr:Gfo/Idh/MocA family oxidoreductase [bacterium]